MKTIVLSLLLCTISISAFTQIQTISTDPDGSITIVPQGIISAKTDSSTNSSNVAFGPFTLFSNTTGIANTATGDSALYANITGNRNTATGYKALYANTGGSNNTANGNEALRSNTTGYYNTAN